MKQYSDAELDKLIKEAVCEMVDSVDPPPLEESWARFEKKYYGQKKTPVGCRRNGYSFFLRLAAAAGIMLLLAGAFSLSFPAKARAIGERLVSTVETLLNSTQMNIRTEYKHNEPGLLPPPPEDLKELPIDQEKVVSLEEAQSTSPFPVTLPRYLPKGYALERITHQGMVKDTVIITLEYTDPAANSFSISEKNIPDGYVEGYGYDIEDAVVEDIQIESSTGKMIIFKNGDIKVRWIKQGVQYELDGPVSKEEALKIVQSMHE